jgi:hypothetical protein
LVSVTASFAIVSLENGVQYEIDKEVPYLFLKDWDYITFLEDMEYRLESEMLIYEGTYSFEPSQRGLSLQPEYQWKIIRIVAPASSDIFIMSGDKPDTIKIPFFGIDSPISSWTKLVSIENIIFATYTLERAEQ